MCVHIGKLLFTGKAKIISLILISLIGVDAMAESKRFESTHATFLEVYSSQGCYSCPPAEEWINTFRDHDKLWTDVIPVNLHVDYWDYLGWKDPFARSEFSQRQRSYKRFKHTRNIATPGFVVNGKGWNGWFARRALPMEPMKNKGELSAELNSTNLSVSFISEQSFRSPYVHTAILGFGTKTKIPRGENAGKTLDHDFVIVGYHKDKLRNDKGNWTKNTYLPPTVDVEMDRMALVVWITDLDDPYPIQALGGWL